MEAQAELRRRTPSETEAYRDGLQAGFAIAASIADGLAEENERSAADLHRRSNRQALISEDRAEQTKISAQVLDDIALEARAIAAKIRERADGLRKAADTFPTDLAKAPSE